MLVIAANCRIFDNTTCVKFVAKCEPGVSERLCGIQNPTIFEDGRLCLSLNEKYMIHKQNDLINSNLCDDLDNQSQYPSMVRYSLLAKAYKIPDGISDPLEVLVTIIPIYLIWCASACLIYGYELRSNKLFFLNIVRIFLSAFCGIWLKYLIKIYLSESSFIILTTIISLLFLHGEKFSLAIFHVIANNFMALIKLKELELHTPESQHRRFMNEVLNVVHSGAENYLQSTETANLDLHNDRMRGRVGLANLGNTCFMNSTLQCLAHTDILREYFLSNDYLKDLNKNNPLGTGGEMATEFAKLLKQMWGDRKKVRSGRNYISSALGRYSGYYDGVIYPKSFKSTLGRHAEQFMGFDQHDSQELATYLLDALHEDTNLVTRKPYVEKPEQEDNESDLDAARKAWDAHTNREHSFINDIFVGLVKSKVTCPVEECGRVSITYDPFMYLSVPIPGTTEVTISVTFVHLDPLRRLQRLSLTIPKSASIADLLSHVSSITGVKSEDLYMVDIWKYNVHAVFRESDKVSSLKNYDELHVYELEPLEIITEREKAIQKSRVAPSNSHPVEEMSDVFAFNGKDWLQLPETIRHKYQEETEWMNFIRDHFNQSDFNLLIDTRISAHGERVQFINQLQIYIGAVKKILTKNQVPDDTESETIDSSCFHGIRNMEDVLTLEYCGEKFRQWTEFTRSESSEINKHGIIITCLISGEVKPFLRYHHDISIATPIIMRIPSNLSVHHLRRELATRLKRVLNFDAMNLCIDSFSVGKNGDHAAPKRTLLEYTIENKDPGCPKATKKKRKACTGDNVESEVLSIEVNKEELEDEFMEVIARVPLTIHSRMHKQAHKLGSIDQEEVSSNMDIKAVSKEELKQLALNDKLDCGTIITLHFCTPKLAASIDLREWESFDSNSDMRLNAKMDKKCVTLLECIEKYCRKEQLEASEKWYCNRCEAHVQAWKYTNIFQAPPILIIQLKRFTFSPVTHRRNKINIHVDFPLEGLDLTSCVLHWEEGQEPIYDCFAVSNHYGGLGGGHYTAYALNHGKWCHFDDSSVNVEIHEREVVTSAAYVLYYRRRNYNKSTIEPNM